MNQTIRYLFFTGLLTLALFLAPFDFISNAQSSAEQEAAEIASSLDENQNRVLDDAEILNAIQMWILGEALPDGKTIDDVSILSLVQIWITGESIRPPLMGDDFGDDEGEFIIVWGVALGSLNYENGIDDATNFDAVFSTTGVNRVCPNGAAVLKCQDVSADTNDSRGVAVGDVGGHSALDLVFANGGEGRFNNRVCLNTTEDLGALAYTCSDISSDAVRSNGVALGDMDNNGSLDAVFANSGQNHICLNNAGVFTCSNVSEDDTDSNGVALGDMDGNGFFDIVFANSGKNRVCLNNEGVFTCSDVSADEGVSNGVALGDLDFNGDIDIVFANSLKNQVCLKNDGVFDCTEISTDESLSFGVALGDVNNNGFIDAVFSNLNENTWCRNDDAGGLTCEKLNGDNKPLRQSNGVALADVDENGSIDAAFAESETEPWLCFNTSGTFGCLSGDIN